ncbi:recombinase RecF [Archaeoglobales archaeon]|nr:MAG: recombinase RecF [Archaeoglobales archaeon]
MIYEFRVQNFKSLKDVKIKLRKFNLLVGRNATGKTNVIDAFKLLKDVSWTHDPSFFNPFFKWGGYQNVVWRGWEELPIMLGYKAKVEDYDVSYEVYFTGYGGKFEILRESIDVSGVVNVTMEGNKLTIKHRPKFVEEVLNRVKEPIFTPVGGKISISKDLLIFQEYEIQERKTLRRSGWSATYSENFAIGTLHIPTKSGEVPVIISPTVKEKIRVRYGFDKFKEEMHFEPLITYVASSASKLMHPTIILRQLNFEAIATPQLVKKEIVLTEDGSNLANVLHTIYTEKGGIPRRIERVLRAIFGNVEVRPKITEDGRVFIQVYENGYPLLPRNVSDGFWKVLTILTAIELNPSIILIDELENSLHPEAIEYIVNELKNSNSVVIATTHSPAVVDIVSPEDLILFEKDKDGKTIVKRVKDASKVRKWLAEHGITLSEGWLYGEIF